MLVQKYLKGETAVNIASSLEEAVSSGALQGGESIPPVRIVAAQLQVSPATVAAAYRLLRNRGVITTEGRRGTRIRSLTPVVAPPAVVLPRGTRDLSHGNPDPEFLPDLNRALRKLEVERKLYGGELNEPALLTAARRRVGADDVPSEHVAVVSGALDGMERVLREHLRPGDRVIVEEPCFNGITDLLAGLALHAAPAEVDDEGMIPEALEKALRKQSAAVIVTPRAQNPTGAAYSPGRQAALRRILRRHGGLLLIEDDHAGPVAGAPYRTLVTEQSERWAVIRSVSKSLGPDLRLAIMAGDRQTIERVEGRQTLGIRWVSSILQSLVLALWNDAAVQKQLDRAERVYAERREAMIEALRAQGLQGRGASGLNVWIPLGEESSTVQRLLQEGWAVTPGERYRVADATGIRVTVASLEPKDAVRFAADLAAILAPRPRGSSA